MTTPPTAATPDHLLDDDHLVRALLRGDWNAAAALHHRVRTIVAATIQRLLGDDRGDGELILHQVEEEIARRIARRERGCTLDSWIAGTTARALYLRLYHEAASARSGPGAPLPRSSPTTPAERVRMHLHAMPALGAWVLVLHDACGYDLAKLARLTRLEVRSASRRLGAARRDLYGRLRGDAQLVAELGTDFADAALARFIVEVVLSTRNTEQPISDASADERGIRQMEEILRGVVQGRRRLRTSMGIALALAFTVGSAAACREAKYGPDAAPSEAEARVSRADAEKIALAAVPGGTLKKGELERENEKLVWSFDIATRGATDITEVQVDARSGGIVSVAKEPP